MKKIKLFACAMLALMCLSFSGCGATSGHDGDRINQLMLARIDDSSTALVSMMSMEPRSYQKLRQ